jgi:hypothetical protein
MTLSLYLTAAVFRVSVSDRVPAIAYQTRADVYVAICNRVIALVAVENAFVGKAMVYANLSSKQAEWWDNALFGTILVAYIVWTIIFWMRIGRQDRLSDNWMHEKVKIPSAERQLKLNPSLNVGNTKITTKDGTDKSFETFDEPKWDDAASSISDGKD